MKNVYVIRNLKTNQYWDGNFSEFDGIGFCTTKYLFRVDAETVLDSIQEKFNYDLYLSIDKIYVSEKD